MMTYADVCCWQVSLISTSSLANRSSAPNFFFAFFLYCCFTAGLSDIDLKLGKPVFHCCFCSLSTFFFLFFFPCYFTRTAALLQLPCCFTAALLLLYCCFTGSTATPASASAGAKHSVFMLTYAHLCSRMLTYTQHTAHNSGPES